MSKPKASVPATTKALQAWQSELRRLEKRLEEWAADLAGREEMLEQQETALADAIDGADDETVRRYADSFPPAENDCGCTPEDASAGCYCPKCEDTREDWVKTFDDVPDSGPRTAGKQPVGDEVAWLEDLWRLEDKRKKK